MSLFPAYLNQTRSSLNSIFISVIKDAIIAVQVWISQSLVYAINVIVDAQLYQLRQLLAHVRLVKVRKF